MTKHTITAFYDSREYANNAVLMLRQEGIPDADVTISPETASPGTANDAEPRAKGFWSSLEEMFSGTDDHHTYAEGVRRGGIMVAAHVDEDKIDGAVEILDRHGSIDLNERETAWRKEGWTGAPVITGGGVANEGAGPLRSMSSVEDTGQTSMAPRETKPAAIRVPAATAAVAAPIASAAAKPVAATRAPVGDNVIQVVEESINVGKRAVNRGKVRIHSYVVETPFSETVNLRDETVSVERRPVSRAIGAAELGVDAFRDQTIEMDEVDEEAIVAKSARVVEEIGIRKEVTDRAHTVTDTLRSTKVDIDDGRTNGRPVGTATSLFGDAAAIQRAKDMAVIGSDGQHVGAVDHVDGDTIKLKRNDPASGGSHHLIPTSWVERVDSMVHLKVTAKEAMTRWTAA